MYNFSLSANFLKDWPSLDYHQCTVTHPSMPVLELSNLKLCYFGGCVVISLCGLNVHFPVSFPYIYQLVVLFLSTYYPFSIFVWETFI